MTSSQSRRRRRTNTWTRNPIHRYAVWCFVLFHYDVCWLPCMPTLLVGWLVVCYAMHCDGCDVVYKAVILLCWLTLCCTTSLMFYFLCLFKINKRPLLPLLFFYFTPHCLHNTSLYFILFILFFQIKFYFIFHSSLIFSLHFCALFMLLLLMLTFDVALQITTCVYQPHNPSTLYFTYKITNFS